VNSTNYANSLDMIFLISGSPLPAMLDMVVRAKTLGSTPILIILDRGESDLIIDDASFDFEVLKIKVNYSSVGLSRLLSMPHIRRVLKRLVKHRLRPQGYVMTSTFDLLLLAVSLRFCGSFSIRHQVRDLHKIQLRNGPIFSLFRFVERLLMRSVDKLIVSSQGFLDGYYSHIYSGDSILLENVPPVDIWKTFKKKNFSRNELVIGFIGIIRYKKSLFALIDAVEKLRLEGKNVRVLFAGGSMGDDLVDLQSKITISDGFTFSGPYQYSRDIKDLYGQIDLIYAVYDEHDLNCKIAMPNKFYEAILTGYPILVAANTFVGDQVESLGIGRAICLQNKNELEVALLDAMSETSWFQSAQKVLEVQKISEYVSKQSIAMDKSVSMDLNDGVLK